MRVATPLVLLPIPLLVVRLLMLGAPSRLYEPRTARDIAHPHKTAPLCDGGAKERAGASIGLATVACVLGICHFFVKWCKPWPYGMVSGGSLHQRRRMPRNQSNADTFDAIAVTNGIVQATLEIAAHRFSSAVQVQARTFTFELYGVLVDVDGEAEDDFHCRFPFTKNSWRTYAPQSFFLNQPCFNSRITSPPSG